tara:strand:- start:38 stop:277 length:240 start_codon:yes stop_codon:yes gene_type:complete
MFSLHKLSIQSYNRSHLSSALKCESVVGGFDHAHEQMLRRVFGNTSRLSARLPQVWSDKGTIAMVNVVVVVGDGPGDSR